MLKVFLGFLTFLIGALGLFLFFRGLLGEEAGLLKKSQQRMKWAWIIGLALLLFSGLLFLIIFYIL